jgi:glycosyltransferase involved in cell wall biosynthesis
VKIAIVAPYSPRWNNIASVRWEKFAKYLSKDHSVYLITSCFPDRRSFRDFNVGNADLVEIPLKYFKRNSYVANKSDSSMKTIMVSSLIPNLKGELRLILEKFLPVSSGGMLLHNYRAYLAELDKIIDGKETILITTYDPWFSLRLGNYFKRRYPNRVIWFADFRDRSFDIAHVVAKFICFKYLTKRILTLADGILVVTKQMLETYQRICGQKVFFLPNGYDGQFSLRIDSQRQNESLKIVYTGSFCPKTREITWFIHALLKLKQKQDSVCSKLKFIYAGKDFAYVQRLFERFSLLDLLENHGFVSRDEALNLQNNADLLLLIAYTGDDPKEGSSMRTGKVYEYLATGKPILTIAPKNWEMREELESDGVSRVFERSESEEIANYIAWFFKERRQIDLKRREEVVRPYLYENLSKRLEEIIETVSRKVKSHL